MKKLGIAGTGAVVLCLAFVLCVNGKGYPCIWKANLQPPEDYPDEVQKCIMAHEEDHVSNENSGCIATQRLD